MGSRRNGGEGRREKGSIPMERTKSQEDYSGKRKPGEGKEGLASISEGSVKKKVRVNPDQSNSTMVDMEELTVGAGIQSHQSP
ncbi:unnamed protein product [Ilex paraguariensis]|uniref:Uncharacterized protein n=2 Tax=Ilex paraguariensis TaxID=185542 RepID=A0ABC8UIL4_9AQUA